MGDGEFGELVAQGSVVELQGADGLHLGGDEFLVGGDDALD